MKIRRVAVLFSELSGYMAACLRALKENHGIELLVFRWKPAPNAPFSEETFSFIDALYNKEEYSRDQITHILHDFEPHCMFISGWVDKDYLKIAKDIRKQGVPVIAGTDAQWHGTLKQHIGRFIAPWYLHSSIDVLWAAGERQVQLANRMGYQGSKCWSGYYACDWEQFASAKYNRHMYQKPSFLYVGRYVPIKGIDVLVEAYQNYRNLSPNPWDLTCAGTGPQSNLFAGVEGIIDKGFTQPDQLPTLMSQASAFVLPSRKEPWGVVLHEAAACGLPLICSDASGAAVHLLRDQYNGYAFNKANVDHLTSCLIQMSSQSEEVLDKMGQRSLALSRQFTPELWANTFVQGMHQLLQKQKTPQHVKV